MQNLAFEFFIINANYSHEIKLYFINQISSCRRFIEAVTTLDIRGLHLI